MTCGWTGVCRPVFKKVPSSNYRKLPSYPLLWWILAENHPFFAIFHQFLDNPPLFMENLPKKEPLFREFGAQKPTHMGGTYPYPQHVMYPPGFLTKMIKFCFLAGMARPGVLGGGGRSPPPKIHWAPPSALEFLKIFVHCRHCRNLLVMLSESIVAF